MKFAIIDSSRGGHEEQAQERRGPAVQRAGGRLPRRLPVRACTPRTTTSRRSAASAGRRSRRSTTTSRASRPAPRRPTRASRRSTATPRTSSTRRSARRSRSTRSPRARRSSSRSPASAASASSTRPRRRASRASASTPTRPTSGPQVFTSALKKVDVAVFNAIKGVQDDKYTGGQDVINSVKTGGIGYGKLNAAAEKYADQVKQVQEQIASGKITRHPGHRQVGMENALELRGITKRFGPIVANDGGRLRPEARRGPRAARGERRRQVDADERPLRALHSPTRARSASTAGPSASTRRCEAIDLGIGMVHQHFMLVPVMTVAENIVLANEPRKGVLLDFDAASRARARAVGPLRPRRRPRRAHRGRLASACSSASRSCARCSAARGSSSSTSRPPCSPPRRRSDLFRVLEALKARRHGDRLHLAQARRGARDRRPRDRAAARQAHRHRPDRGRDRGVARAAHGRPRGPAARRQAAARSPRSRCSRSATCTSATTATCRPSTAPT